MALDLWFREDVARILLATYETMRASTSAAGWDTSDVPLHTMREPSAHYQRGFTDAVRAMALAFGVASPAALAAPQLVGYRVEPVSRSHKSAD